MSSPVLLGSNLLRASRSHVGGATALRRGLAAAASGSFQYESGEASGVKYASRDLPGPTTTLTVVARAGTRYQPLPGYSDALEKFAFKVSGNPIYRWNVFLNTSANDSPLSNAQHFGLHEKQSFSAESFLPIIPERTLSYGANSSEMIYHILQSFLERSYQKQDTRVSSLRGCMFLTDHFSARTERRGHSHHEAHSQKPAR